MRTHGRVINQIRTELHILPVVVQVPIGVEDQREGAREGVIDLVRRKLEAIYNKGVKR